MLVDRCPRSWMITAFIERTMKPEDRVGFVEHLAICTRCRDAYLLRRQHLGVEHGSGWKHGTAVLTLVIVLLVTMMASMRRVASPNVLTALAAAMTDARFRSVEPRLSVIAVYQPLRRERPGASDTRF